MSRFVLGYGDVSTSAFYSGGSWQNGLGTKMLKRELITAAARTTNSSDFDLDVTLNHSQSNKVVGLINHNLTSSGTWRVRAYSDSGRSNVLTDTGPINVGIYEPNLNYKTCLAVLDDVYDTAYWRFSFSDAANPDGYFKLGNLFIGKKFNNDSWGQNMDYGVKKEPDASKTQIHDSTAGVESYIRAPLKRQYLFQMALQNQGITDEYYAIGLELGITERVLFEMNSEHWNDGKDTLVGRFADASALESQFYNANALNFMIREII